MVCDLLPRIDLVVRFKSPVNLLLLLAHSGSRLPQLRRLLSMPNQK